LSDHYIEFRNFTKAFDDRVVLNDVSFYVDRGETCVILGRSGVGKSVSLKHILGFLKPDSGQVFVAGEDITGWSEEQMAAVRRRIAMVFQSGALFDSLTVAENVAYPLENRDDRDAGGLDQDQIDRRVNELLELLEVAEFADRYPSELSTGTKRAVAIARALAQEPEAILYDEPTTMVDPIMAAYIGDLIRKLKDTVHKTSLVVTHDTHLAKKLADSVVFLHEGRVAFFGPWRDFENSPDPFLRNFLLQDALVPAIDHIV
jgi:phospholipid/cholesterol/gamma-HCH transport system ATP-binding protein